MRVSKGIKAQDMRDKIEKSARNLLINIDKPHNSVLSSARSTSNINDLDTVDRPVPEAPRLPKGTADAAADGNPHIPDTVNPSQPVLTTQLKTTPTPPQEQFTSVFEKYFGGLPEIVNTEQPPCVSEKQPKQPATTRPSPAPQSASPSQPPSSSSSTAASASSPALQTASTPPSKDKDNPFVDFVLRYRENPADLVKNVFGAEPDPWQEEFLSHIQSGARRISVRAGHGVGKSTACAWAVIWHLITRYPQKVVCTAPTAPQLYDALFAEIKFWINKLPAYMRQLFEITSDRIVLKSSPEASFVSARTSSKEKPEALAGVHSDNVLLIVDEASAVEEAVFESAAGSMSGHNATTVLIGNPTRSSGLFYKTHHELAPEWRTMHVSCVTSPRVTEDFVKQIKDTYGELSNAFRVRVLGEFPLADDDTLIPAELVDAAMRRDIHHDTNEPILFGVDPARFGDDAAVLCVRQGNVVMHFRSWRGLDLMSLCGAIVNEAEQLKPEEINVDSIGLGAGLADRLRELGLPVRDVNVSEVSALNPKANRLRDELWISVRDFLAQRACRLPNEESLRADLVTPKYSFTSSGKLQVESKGEMKKRLRRSPDFADALALTFAGRGAMVGGRMASWVPGKPLQRRISIC
jgi:phage terminase large subunit